MNFRLSRHAEEEMVRRQISPTVLEEVLEHPQQRVPHREGIEILQSLVESAHGTMYLLRVVVAVDKEPPVVVTVYRTTKIHKYWRAP